MILFYVIFFFLILRFAITLFNFISNPKLTASPRHYHDLVSILIPARNEEQDILVLLESIQKQAYAEFEVIVYDDHSSDNTAALCQIFSQIDPRFKIIKGNEPPRGWIGKNYACHQLAKEAKGKYLMFLDADVVIKPGLINNSVHRMKMNKLSLLSLFANQEMRGIGEWAVVPLMNFILLNLLPVRLVRLSSNTFFAAASGQFMLFDADVYRTHTWHEQVRDYVAEDIEIMKLVKRNQLGGETLMANGYLSSRKYKSYTDAIEGYSKNLLPDFNNNIASLLSYLVLLILGPIFVANYLDVSLFFFTITLIVLSRVMISLVSGQNILWNIILHPMQMVSLVIISVLTVKNKLTNTTKWKGRKIKV